MSGFSGGYAPRFLNVDPGAISTAPADPLTGFDTVVLAQICDIGNYLANTTFRARLENFVTRGGKLVIWDSECRNTNYSNFFFPFTSNNPGALGAHGTLRILEENSLSSASATSPYYINVGPINTQTDAVGDANVFTTKDPNWCVDMEAVNATLPGFHPTHNYVVFGQGLIIYSGLDMDEMPSNMPGPGNNGIYYLARVWELELRQPWNPSGLPCGVAATQANITLTAANPTIHIGETESLTALVTDTTGHPVGGVHLALSVTGANANTQTAITDAAGAAVFQYQGKVPGDDTAVAKAGAISSGTAPIHWYNLPPMHPGRSSWIGATARPRACCPPPHPVSWRRRRTPSWPPATTPFRSR